HQSGFLTAGSAGRITGRKAQCFGRSGSPANADAARPNRAQVRKRAVMAGPARTFPRQASIRIAFPAPEVMTEPDCWKSRIDLFQCVTRSRADILIQVAQGL